MLWLYHQEDKLRELYKSVQKADVNYRIKEMQTSMRLIEQKLPRGQTFNCPDRSRSFDSNLWAGSHKWRF